MQFIMFIFLYNQFNIYDQYFLFYPSIALNQFFRGICYDVKFSVCPKIYYLYHWLFFNKRKKSCRNKTLSLEFFFTNRNFICVTNYLYVFFSITSLNYEDMCYIQLTDMYLRIYLYLSTSFSVNFKMYSNGRSCTNFRDNQRGMHDAYHSIYQIKWKHFEMIEI